MYAKSIIICSIPLVKLQAQKNNKVFKFNKLKHDYFTVRHYAGSVDYDTRGFLEKNHDKLTSDVVEMFWAEVE